MIQEALDRVDMDQIMTQVVSYLPDLAASLLLIIAFWLVLVIARRLVNNAMKRADVATGIRELTVRCLKYGIVILAVLTIANQLGFNITSLVAGLGVAGLAVSLAAQDTVQNVIAGITLAIDRPFKQGDWISIGDKNVRVSDIRLRSTVFTTFENETMVIPNQDVASERIVNYTLTEQMRVRVPVGIAYGEDIEEAREVMLKTLQGVDRILREPEPKVLTLELGGSSVNMELRFWIEDPWEMLPIRCEYIEKCKKALDDADIEIPFPHMQLLLEQSEGLSELSTACRSN